MQRTRALGDIPRHIEAQRNGDSDDGDQDLADTQQYDVRELCALVRITEEISIEVSLDDFAPRVKPRRPPAVQVPAKRGCIPASFEVLAKPAPMLVLSDSVATRLPARPVHHVESTTMAATATTTPVTTTSRAKPQSVATRDARDARVVVDFDANVLRRGYFKRRFLALTLLGLVVLTQPWWWNVGSVRAVSVAAHR